MTGTDRRFDLLSVKGGIRYLPASVPFRNPDTPWRMRQCRSRCRRHRCRCKGERVPGPFFRAGRACEKEYPGGIPGNPPPPPIPRLRSHVRLRREVLHILSCPPRPPGSGQFLRLQEYFGISGPNLQGDCAGSGRKGLIRKRKTEGWVSRCYGPGAEKAGRSKSAIRANAPWKAGRPMDRSKIHRPHECTGKRWSGRPDPNRRPSAPKAP